MKIYLTLFVSIISVFYLNGVKSNEYIENALDQLFKREVIFDYNLIEKSLYNDGKVLGPDDIVIERDRVNCIYFHIKSFFFCLKSLETDLELDQSQDPDYKSYFELLTNEDWVNNNLLDASSNEKVLDESEQPLSRNKRVN